MRLSAIGVLLVLSLAGLPHAVAQDETTLSPCEQIFTNTAQIAQAFNCDVLCLPANPPPYRAWLIYPQFLWADFTQLPEQFSAALVESQDEVQGVKVLKLRVTRFILTGETLVEFPADTNSLLLAAPADYEASQQDSTTRSALRGWQQYLTWEDVDTQNILPTLRLTLPLADVQCKPAYDAAIAAEEAACEEAAAASALRTRFGGMFTSSEEEEGSEFDLLAASSTTACGRLKWNKLQVSGTNFVLEWFSDTNATYEIASSSNMTTPASNWTALASLYPAAAGSNLTSYVDVGAATNTAKFYKVAKTGISLAMCPNTMLSGMVIVPFELGLPTNQPPLDVFFLLDGNGSLSLQAPTNIATTCATWDTTTATNGTHTLQAVVTYATLSSTPAGYISQVVTVQTANAVVFPDFPFTFGTRLPINALLSASNANWTVTVRDSIGGTLWTTNGTTANGKINTAWTGSSTDAWVEIEVNSTPTGLGPDEMGGTSGGGSKKKVFKSIGGFANGYMVSYEDKCNDEVSDGGVADLCTSIAQQIDDNSQDIAIQSDIANNPTAWTAWKNSLNDPNVGSLYLFAHGSPQTMGYDPSNVTGGGRRGVFSSEIATMLRNGQLGSDFLMTHGFRHVFLDGCNSAGETELLGLMFIAGGWNNAFGIENKDYTATGSEPQAFMGWKVLKGFIDPGGTGMFDASHRSYVSTFYSGWSQGKTLQQASDDAYSLYHDLLFPQKPVIFGANSMAWR